MEFKNLNRVLYDEFGSELQEMLARMAMPEVSYDHESSLSYSSSVVRLTLIEMYHLI